MTRCRKTRFSYQQSAGEAQTSIEAKAIRVDLRSWRMCVYGRAGSYQSEVKIHGILAAATSHPCPGIVCLAGSLVVAFVIPGYSIALPIL